MRKAFRLLIPLLMLSGTPSLIAQSSDIPKIDPDFYQKTEDSLIACDIQNQACQATIKSGAETPVQDNWGIVAAYCAVAAVLAAIAQHQLDGH